MIMKKYMKPIMESECFVSNEYVAACYLADCKCITDPGYLIKDVDNINDAMKSFNQQFNGTTYKSGNDYIFIGSIYGNSSCDGASADSHTSSESVGKFNEFVNIWNSIPFIGWLWPIKKLNEIKDHHDVTFTDTSTISGYAHPNAS